MKCNVYCFYDSAATAYTQPFFLHTDGQATRAFMDQINSDKSQKNLVALHPDQFTLFRIGEWDDSSGCIVCYDPVSLGNGIQFVENKVSEGDIGDIKSMIRHLLDTFQSK